MTKKHFVALADLLRRLCPIVRANDSTLLEMGRYQQWETLRDALADFCQAQNGNFNRERWLAYVAGTAGSNGGKR